MKKEELLIEILRSTFEGKKIAVCITPDEWKALFSFAHNQYLFPIVFESVRLLPVDEACERVFCEYKRKAIIQVAAQIIRNTEFRNLYAKLIDSSLHPIVVKGQLCSRLYPMPKYRITADDDIFISKGEAMALHNKLIEFGMTTDAADDEINSADEVSYYNDDKTMYIEVHRSLFDSAAESQCGLNRFFDGIFERTVEIDGFLAMPPHEHLLYLLLHAYKHFIYSGVGIRQVCDIGLWAREYEADIDWELLAEQCGEVHAFGFAAAVFAIAGRKLGILKEESAVSVCPAWAEMQKIDVEPLLDDMLNGGVYGSDSLTRLHSSTITLNAVAANRTGKRHSVLKSIFPGKRYMSARYPCIKKCSLLLPAAWVSRAVSYFFETVRTKNSSASASIALGRSRIELLRKYGVIDR